MNREKLSKIYGWLIYAAGHLDDYYGYDDEVAISSLAGAIDELIKLEKVEEHFKISELEYWKKFALNVKDTHDRDNAVTMAIAGYLSHSVGELLED